MELPFYTGEKNSFHLKSMPIRTGPIVAVIVW